MRTLLIVVHPGSCCGSADFNCGDAAAEAAREILAGDLDDWAGALAVIDGDLSSELRLRKYRGLGAALEAALERAAAAGQPAIRIRGGDEDEFDQVAAALSLAESLGLSSGAWKVETTGAWYDPTGSEGCVNSVVEALATAGVSVTVRPSAVMLDVDPPQDGDSPAAPIPYL
jgi:hypothetical protein